MCHVNRISLRLQLPGTCHVVSRFPDRDTSTDRQVSAPAVHGVPNISPQIEAAFLAQNLPKVRRLIEIFTPFELTRAQHGTAYNIAPLKWLLKNLYQIGAGQSRPASWTSSPLTNPLSKKSPRPLWQPRKRQRLEPRV